MGRPCVWTACVVPRGTLAIATRSNVAPRGTAAPAARALSRRIAAVVAAAPTSWCA